MKRAKSVDEYLKSNNNWLKELQHLRSVILQTELVETIKWGMPTYTINGKNVVGMSGFKEHFGLWFFQGVFLKDPENKLLNAQEGITKAMRQMRFKNINEIDASIILSYLEEAIQNQKDGKVVKPERKSLVIPHLIKEALGADALLKEAFNQFSLSKKREFSEFIENAKREETKLSRVQKIIPMIIKGIGLNDKYK